MQNKDDGGAAFPIPRNHSSGDAIYAPGDGMSLRDYFAAAVLASYDAISLRAILEQSQAEKVRPQQIIAAFAYSVADAMLEARK